MDKKFIALIVIFLIIVAFQGKIKAYLAILNTLQKLMLGQILLLIGVLTILLYYIVSRSEKE